MSGRRTARAPQSLSYDIITGRPKTAPAGASRARPATLSPVLSPAAVTQVVQALDVASPTHGHSKGLTLKYWSGRGLMEVPRMMLAIAGKFPSSGDYVDGRYITDPDLVDERTGLYSEVNQTLTANLGRMPTADIGGDSIGQSAAINYYVASECGLMGANHLEAAKIIMIQEHLKEMMLAFRSVLPYGSEPTEELLDKWFDSGAEDFSPSPADMSRRSERFLTWWTNRIEDTVGANGFAVGSRLSLADVLIYNTFAEHLDQEQAAGPAAEASWRREAFCSKARTDARIAKCPRLHAIIQTVASNPNVQRWLRERGVQRF